MADKQNRGFDLTAVLRLSILDIRRVAQKNLYLTVGDYIDLLYRFKVEGPRAINALEALSAKSIDNESLRAVQEIRELLEEMGCKKWPVILSDAISAVMKNNLDLSADVAKSIIEPFAWLYKKIINAEIVETKSDFYFMDENVRPLDITSSFSQTLITHLDRLELEEHSRKLQILVVDDSSMAIKSVFAALGNNYKVYGMINPTKVEEFLEKVTPELFLLDYKMPERTGFELIPIIRSFEEHRKTPIIILTAMGSIDHISAAHSLGASDFIVKPFQKDLLRKKIARHIKKKKLT
ncbi:MAG: response regulator [Treponema sp.]|jgi:PleD family two-component response regulator|nr:response regulator [Treponema sp.]